MRHWTRLFELISTGFAIIIAVANFSRDIKLDDPQSIFKTVGLWLQPYAGVVILWLAIAVAVLQLLEAVIETHTFKKELVVGFLDDYLKKHFPGARPQDNRLTLFRLHRGWYILFFVLPVRLLSQDEPLRVFGHTVKKLFRGGFIAGLWRNDYLYAYARATQSINQKSCTIYRVSFNRPTECEGMAGLTAVKDWVEIPDLPDFPDGALRTMKELSDYSASAPERIYAEMTNIKHSSDLRMLNRYARHFLKCVIYTTDGKRVWGTLLLDSRQSDCPFPDRYTAKGRSFAKYFENDAATLSRILT